MATLAVISHRVGLHDLLTHLHLLQDTLRHQGARGYLVYAALFIIATLCLIPGSLLVIAGGMLFGPLTGSLLSFAAATLASSLSFLIARWLGRDLLQRYVGHTTVFQAIERGIARSGCDFLILTRLVPLFPYNIQNYAYGLTAIRFWPFTLISAVTTLPGLVIYSVMASELAREGVTLAFALKLSLAGGLLFALVQIGKRFARARLALAVVVAAALAAWLWFPGGRTFLQQSLTALASLDPQQVRGFIAAWGPQAALVSFALMILQAIVAPLPAFLITLANAALFGAFWGGALSWFSAMVGAGLCFCIARALGREVVEKLTGRAVLRSADGYFTRFGPQTILVCRLLPFVPFDPVSYAAGLTSLRFWPFMLATGVGQLPATIVYSWAGSLLTGGTFWLATGLSLLFALAVVISIAKNIYRERHKRSSP
ncbi:TPA: TVP38/TMEM64 family protein [Klebsiella pneumoniae]|nr:TVP38/TMEM64 family protein [Klebsiella pneumoniae]